MALSENSKSVAVGGRRDVAADGGDMGDVSQLVANGAQVTISDPMPRMIPRPSPTYSNVDHILPWPSHWPTTLKTTTMAAISGARRSLE